MKKLSFVLFVLCCTFGNITGQDFDIPDSFQSYSAIYLEKSVTYNISFQNDSIKITSHHVHDILINKDVGTEIAEKELYFSQFKKIENIKAETRNYKNKRRYKAIEVVDFKEKDVLSGGIFYDDLKAISFRFPQSSLGSVLHLEYDVLYTDPRLIGPNFFATNFPIIKSKIGLIYEPEVKIEYILKGMDSENIQIIKSNKNGLKNIIWTYENINPMTYQEMGPDPRYYEPQVLFYVKSIEKENNTLIYNENDSTLYKWCYDFISNINRKSPELLQNIADSITQGLSSDLEKSKAIFYWVQENISYIAFEAGYEGYIPRDALLTFENRYGDCKDMANMISYMHSLIGLKSHMTWIGSRDLPYSVKEVPIMSNFNHMIATYKHNGVFYYLDATGDYHPYEYPTSMIQGKEALISIGPDSFELQHVPIMPAKNNVFKDSMVLRIKNDTLFGKGYREFTGYYSQNLKYEIEKRDSKKRDEYLKAYLRTSNDKSSVQKINWKYDKRNDNFMEINYDISIPDQMTGYKNERYFTLHLRKFLQDKYIDTADRKAPIEQDFKNLVKEYVKIYIPEKYEISYLPKNVNYSHEYFSFSFEYLSLDDNSIILKKEIKRDFLLIDQSNIPSWNEMVAKLEEAYSENIVLKLK